MNDSAVFKAHHAEAIAKSYADHKQKNDEVALKIMEITKMNSEINDRKQTNSNIAHSIPLIGNLRNRRSFDSS